MNTQPKAFQPPYNISWATFLSTLERMAADPPNRVDRSYLGSQSGTIQTYLIAAYKAFGLIDEVSRPTDHLLRFAQAEDRKDLVADLLRTHYPTIVPLGETNSTQGELSEAFGQAFDALTGESRVKAIRFFLAGAGYAGLKLSPLWKAPKAPRGGSSPRRSSRNGKGAQASAASVDQRPTKPRPQTLEEAKLAYFDLLINNAGKDTKLDPDVLNRIERLVGIPGPDSEQPANESEGQALTEPNLQPRADPRAAGEEA